MYAELKVNTCIHTKHVRSLISTFLVLLIRKPTQSAAVSKRGWAAAVCGGTCVTEAPFLSVSSTDMATKARTYLENARGQLLALTPPGTFDFSTAAPPQDTLRSTAHTARTIAWPTPKTNHEDWSCGRRENPERGSRELPKKIMKIFTLNYIKYKVL